MKKKFILGSILIATLLLGVACSSTSTATNFNGLTTPNGKPIAHQSTSNVALHLLFSTPLWGDATLEGTVADFTDAAKQGGAKKVSIVQSSVTTWWFIFPPFTLVLAPVTSNVAGDVLP
ncbi:TPA: hypothetical protein DDW35_11910 [Candidatus Sumerlaeota bacterium]|jgi:hypothetical protein|nr:hypothetical protein [Candidatus Sumerlaeota bacterium]